MSESEHPGTQALEAMEMSFLSCTKQDCVGDHSVKYRGMKPVHRLCSRTIGRLAFCVYLFGLRCC